MAAHISLAKQHALSDRSSPRIVVGFATLHTHSLRFGTRKRKELPLVEQRNFWARTLSPQLLFNISLTTFNSLPNTMIRCCYHRIPSLWTLLSIPLLNLGVLQHHLHPRFLINSEVLLTYRMNRGVLMLNLLTLLLIDLSRADIIKVVR